MRDAIESFGCFVREFRRRYSGAGKRRFLGANGVCKACAWPVPVLLSSPPHSTKKDRGGQYKQTDTERVTLAFWAYFSLVYTARIRFKGMPKGQVGTAVVQRDGCRCERGVRLEGTAGKSARRSSSSRGIAVLGEPLLIEYERRLLQWQLCCYCVKSAWAC